jgi:hypothetical protein
MTPTGAPARRPEARVSSRARTTIRTSWVPSAFAPTPPFLFFGSGFLLFYGFINSALRDSRLLHF